METGDFPAQNNDVRILNVLDAVPDHRVNAVNNVYPRGAGLRMSSAYDVMDGFLPGKCLAAGLVVGTGNLANLMS